MMTQQTDAPPLRMAVLIYHPVDTTPPPKPSAETITEVPVDQLVVPPVPSKVLVFPLFSLGVSLRYRS